ncbi:MAG: hypothetical protein K1000chlam2_01345 [Chlamydiae bacterium]|nr:hypothetical protein [Chlamydiota bacterium]
MKKSLPILCTSFLFCSVFSYGNEEVEEAQTDEIAMLEPSIFAQQPASLEELDLSPSTFAPRHKNPFLAVGLSALVPGLGHIYLEEYKTAGYLLGSTGLFGGLSYSDVLNENFQASNLITMQNVSLYGIYAAYRDVRSYNREEGYFYKMPKDSFADLVWAPFQWSVLKKPEVWGGFLGALTLAAGAQYFLSPEKTECAANHSSKMTFPLLAFPVGIGEESFFRGYLQPMFSEWLTPWGGIILSSLAFGAAHLGNGLFMEPEQRARYYSVGLPVITSFGFYFGWLTYKNCSLKESVALHAWYDFALFLVSYAAVQSAAVGKPSFSISIPF